MGKALIVIDMLEDFIAPDGKLTCGPAGQAIVPALHQYLRLFHRR